MEALLMTELHLTPDQLLSTTRAVRRRFDLDRPVQREVIEDCLRLAQQAPRASNVERRAFVVVTDPQKKEALAELWRRGMERYLERMGAAGGTDNLKTSPGRMRAGIRFLGEHLQDIPVHLIPCVTGRLEGLPVTAQAALWGTIAPATWSFMLAARERGLGTVWTSFHLAFEREAADVLGIPFESVTQTALVPVGYTRGTDFRPAPRESLDTVVHWNGW
jgi:nitroreductase